MLKENNENLKLQFHLNEKKKIFFEDLFSHCINSCYLFKIIRNVLNCKQWKLEKHA